MEFEFFNPVKVDRTAAAKLDETHRKQFVIAARAYAGEDFKTPDDYFDWIFEELGCESRCELWQIRNAKEPERRLFEMWVFEVDSGTVFAADTTKETGVQMIQFGFDYYPKNPEDISPVAFMEASRFADNLQRAFERANKG